MKPVYILNDNMITSLGFTTAENILAIKKGTIGIRTVNDPLLYPNPVPVSIVNDDLLNERLGEALADHHKTSPSDAFTRLEKFFIISIHDVLKNSPVEKGDPRTLLVISTTKGNIDLLEDRFKSKFSHKRLYLWELGRVIQQFFGFVNMPVIVSNACISGVLAIIISARFLQSGAFDHAVVAGGDIATEFVISGFQSFQALSPDPCKPFDLNRTGLSLGEGCGSIVLSIHPDTSRTPLVRVSGASVSNDANHISGPSRTGEELSWAINQAMEQARVSPREISYISAHGTATLFNDEMESKALENCELSNVPVNSFKGYWGHTLGAAGIIESVATISTLRSNYLYRSAGFDTLGVPSPLRVITTNRPGEVNACLKTASGFGGCNAAIIYQKD
ncbi:MAG: beta-ketoacyl synthase N-terminal-like domain-containing protein [Bacteroidales bacterium]|nr:beta-ketoacyl synthase N-terminal-like domain-containing protein [Bacteroidales bacterium]